MGQPSQGENGCLCGHLYRLERSHETRTDGILSGCCYGTGPRGRHTAVRELLQRLAPGPERGILRRTRTRREPSGGLLLRK